VETALDWSLRPAAPADVEPIAELRAIVMRPDLERLGQFDEHRVRQRLRGSAARRLSERHGFTVESADPIDIYLVR